MSRNGIPANVIEAIMKKINLVWLNLTGMILLKRHSPSASFDMYLSYF
jgi:hypothetical protein